MIKYTSSCEILTTSKLPFHPCIALFDRSQLWQCWDIWAVGSTRPTGITQLFFFPQAIFSLILMVGCAVSHPQAGNSRDVHVTQMMNTWTKQMGYPVLTVSKSANNLSQTRFFAVTPEDKNTIPLSPYKWEPLDTAPIILWLRVMVTASPWQISFARCWYIYLCFSLSLSPVSIAYSMHTQLESGEARKWGYHLLLPLFLCCCAQSSSKLLLPLCMWLLHSFAPGFINIATILPIPTSVITKGFSLIGMHLVKAWIVGIIRISSWKLW